MKKLNTIELKTERQKWKKFRTAESKLFESSGLPLEYSRNEKLWIDFLMHGYIDHNPDYIKYTVHDMNNIEYNNFVKLVHLYFEYGFEYFEPVAIKTLGEIKQLREKFEH